MPKTRDPASLPLRDPELSLEEAAQYLAERGYSISAYGIHLMSRKGWGGPPVSWREDGSLFVALEAVAGWVRDKDATKKALLDIDKEEAMILSARSRPLWQIITPFECPEVDVIREVLKAYACDTKLLMDISLLERLFEEDQPDAVVINGWHFKVREVSRIAEEVTARDVHCLLYGLPEDGVIPSDLLAKCDIFDGKFARGKKRSSFAGAPSYLARRMRLDIGLNHEHKQALRLAKYAADDPAYKYEDPMLPFKGA